MAQARKKETRPRFPRFSAEIKSRALEVAARIRAIDDVARRTRIARAVCLDAVIRDPRFPEEGFLALCGAPVADVVGAELRVKKTLHGVRVKPADGTAWGYLQKDPALRKEYRLRANRLRQPQTDHANFHQEADEAGPVATCGIIPFHCGETPFFIRQFQMW